MTQRKSIAIKKQTYIELQKRREYETESLTRVLLRLIDTYGGLI